MLAKWTLIIELSGSTPITELSGSTPITELSGSTPITELSDSTHRSASSDYSYTPGQRPADWVPVPAARTCVTPSLGHWGTHRKEIWVGKISPCCYWLTSRTSPSWGYVCWFLSGRDHECRMQSVHVNVKYLLKKKKLLLTIFNIQLSWLGA